MTATPPDRPGGGDASLHGWASPLAALAAAYLLFQGLTGLWIWLAPTSLLSQLQVAGHVVAGLALTVPWAIYQVRHFLAWWRQKPTAEMVLGYLLATAVIVATVSGFAVTWQAAAGTRVGTLWGLVHQVAGIAAVALLAVHVLLAAARRSAAARRRPDLAAARARFTRRTLAGTALALAAVAVLALRPDDPGTRPLPADYALADFAQSFAEYRDNPFAPSYARTEGQVLVDPLRLAGSESCGTAGCHEQILAEWQPSAHRFAAMNPPFQAIQQAFAADRGAAETRYCAGCHDPISLFAGAKDPSSLDLSAPGVDEGISCAACHSMSQVDQRGNADYVLTPPRRYLGEGGGATGRWLADFLIRAYPRQHLEDYDRSVLRTPESCGACHKQFIPEALNRFGVSEGQNQYDEWRQSHWNQGEESERLSCRDCHMRLVPDSTDPARGETADRFRDADDGAHRHHGFIATNLYMPELLQLPHWEEHVALTREWVRGETALPELGELWPPGPVAVVSLVAPERAAPGEEVAVRVLLANHKAGHNFSTGPLDFIQSWIHLTVEDAAGRLIAEWGALDPETRWITDAPGQPHVIGNRRDEGTLVLEAMPLDEHGEMLRRHELWRKAGGHGSRVIYAGYTDPQTYRFAVPADAAGPLTLRAELAYRRYRQEFLDLVLPGLEAESGVIQPVVIIHEAEAAIDLSPAAAARPAMAVGG